MARYRNESASWPMRVSLTTRPLKWRTPPPVSGTCTVMLAPSAAPSLMSPFFERTWTSYSNRPFITSSPTSDRKISCSPASGVTVIAGRAAMGRPEVSHSNSWKNIAACLVLRADGHRTSRITRKRDVGGSGSLDRDRLARRDGTVGAGAEQDGGGASRHDGRRGGPEPPACEDGTVVLARAGPWRVAGRGQQRRWRLRGGQGGRDHLRRPLAAWVADAHRDLDRRAAGGGQPH